MKVLWNLKSPIAFGTFAAAFALAGCSQQYKLSLTGLSQDLPPPDAPYTPPPLPPGFTTRTMEIDPKTTTSSDPIKVVMVIDNSGSMSDNQKTLAAGVASLLPGLRQYNTDFFLYTTTANLLNDANAAKSTTFAKTTYTYQDAMGTPQTVDMLPSNVSDYTKDMRWALNPPYNGNGSVPLRTRTGMTDSEFMAMQSAMTTAVAEMGTDGSSSESAMCSMSYLLNETQINPVFKKGDRAALLFISDADDATVAATRSTPKNKCYASEKDTYAAGNLTTKTITEMRTALGASGDYLGTALIGKAKDLFGDKGFLMSGVFYNDQLGDTSCSGNIETPSTYYFNFVQELGANGSAQSICSSSYSLALSQIQNFIQVVVQNTLTVTLNEGESIRSVEVIRLDGTHLSPGPSNVSFAAGTIVFKDGYLKPGDRVIVNIATPVTPSPSPSPDAPPEPAT